MKSLSFDAKKNGIKFKPSNAAESEFARALKKVARKSGHIVDVHAEGADIKDDPGLQAALKAYSKMIEPWARKQSAKMLDKVLKSNKRAYQNQSKAMGRALQSGVAEQDVGQTAFALLNEQVALIQSIPLEAGLRAQKIAADNFLLGRRISADPSTVEELKKQMGMSTEVAVNRAILIARTETARANSAFVQARAVSVGSPGYIWRTTMDGAERDSHAQMNGKYVDYTKIPVLSDGTVGHAGTFPNCRCWQDVVLPDTKQIEAKANRSFLGI